MGWIRIDRVTWAERALWMALVAVAIAPVALRRDAEGAAREYVAAVGQGDVEGAVALTGDRARGVLEWRAALNERWRTISWRYDPDQREVHAVVEITNDAWELIDCRPVVEVVLIVGSGDLIVEKTRIESRELRVALLPFLAWAEAERAEELKRVWRERGPRWNAAAARGLLALLREWRDEGPGVADLTPRGQG